MGTTPWEELRALAAAGTVNEQGVMGEDPAHTALAESREYSGDGRLVEAAFDDALRWRHADAELRHADPRVYGFLEALGAKLIPHGSQGAPVYSAGDELDHGHFFDHLVGNEQCLREWQLEEPEHYDDAACLGGLLHSLYGTQGYQAHQFPIERRGEIAALVGERAENLAFWTCAMERSTWRQMVLSNRGLKRGETPVGDFSGRHNRPGVWPADGPHRLSGDEHWKLSAQEFTDMCVLVSSHPSPALCNGSRG